jgi:asparagine synthase (glutamine-hydrolysing)
MCGISGYISQKQFDNEKIIASLNHRGPDSKGSFSEIISGRNVFLGHNRLSIIDLSDNGRQPMTDDTGNVVIIFNGEIYNHIDLKISYLKKYNFKSQTDTEKLVYLYREYGINFINKLNGDFAFALLDRQKKKLFLVRDRVGIKPLYYYLEDDQLVFGSEIKAILAAGIKPEIDELHIPSYLIFKYVPGNDTLFKNIKRIPPGSYLEYDIESGKSEIHTYWTLRKKSEYENISYTDAKEVLYGLLNSAMHLQLMSDVPVGTFFSGGMDSSTIAHFIKEEKQITHYSARKSKSDLKEEGSSSDYDYALKLSKDFDLNLHPVNIGQAELNEEMIKKLIYYSEDLIADGSLVPSYLITQEASKHSKVMLSGMGADEIFYGYAGHQLSLAANYLDSFPKFVSGSIADILANLRPGVGEFKPYKRFLKKFGEYYKSKYRYLLFNVLGYFNNAVEVYQDIENEPEKYFAEYFEGNNDLFDSITQFEVRNFLVKNLHYVDRMCMANSIEGRVPFLDYRIIEFAYSLPRKYKLSNLGRGKVILKETMKPHLPAYIYRRRKAGFGMPLRSIFKSESKINELLDIDFFYSQKGFKPERIKHLTAEHIAGRDDCSHIIYALICFSYWYKMYIRD